MAVALPAYLARARFVSLLEQVEKKKARFMITRNGRPAAVLLGATDFDDILEELDPEFQKTLRLASREYRAGKSLSLNVYMKKRAAVRRSSGVFVPW